jgi:CHAT domain-containing protein
MSKKLCFRLFSSVIILLLLDLLPVKSHSYTGKLSYRELADSTTLYLEKQDFETALNWANAALLEAEEVYGASDTNYINTLSKIGEIYFYLGMSDSALYYFNISLNKNREIYKGDHPAIATNLNNLGFIYKEIGKYNQAEAIFMESLAMNRRLYPTDHPDLATNLDNLANLCQETGKFKEAEPLLLETLEMRRRLNKSDNTELANSINNLAFFYKSTGNLNKAEDLFNEAKNMFTRLNYTDNTDYASILNNLSMVCKTQGRMSEAELLLIEAKNICEHLNLTINPELAGCNFNLSKLYLTQGRLTEAEPLLLESLEIYKSIYSGNHMNIAMCLGSLGMLYYYQGNVAKAELYLLESYEMLKKIYNSDHPELAEVLSDLSIIYCAKGMLKKAISYNLTALEMYKRIIQGEHPSIVTCLNNLAYLYVLDSNYTKSDELFTKAIEISKRLYNSDNLSIASGLNNLAYLKIRIKKYKDAESLLDEAENILNRLFHRPSALAAAIKNNKSLLYSELGKLDLSELNMKEAIEIQSKIFVNQSINLSEREKEVFWNSIKIVFERFNSFAIGRIKDNPEIINNIFENVIFYKSILFNTTNKIKKRIQNSGDSLLIRNFRELIAKRETLSKWYSIPQNELENKGYNIDSLENKVNTLEKEISLKSELFAQTIEKKKIGWRTIQAILRPDEAVVDIIRFRLFCKNSQTDTIIYAALIITENTENYPELVLMPNGTDMESNCYSYYRNCIKRLIDDNESFKNFWASIYEKTKGYKKVFFAPDGIFNKLNLSTLLMPDGKYLIDKQEIKTIVNCRDILTEFYTKQQESNVVNLAVLFGNPDFQLSPENLKKKEQQYSRNRTPEPADTSSRYLNLSPLPGTETEINTIAKFLRSKEWKVNLYQKEDAVKSAVKAIVNPRVVHIATHGLFLPDNDPKFESFLGIDANRMLVNPLLRSGLFFAGASSTFKDRFNPTGSDNGFLTAFEAANLELDRTELVVLSACETGLGDIVNGEGVLGLQRSFLQAGAKSVLISLWKVDDSATQLLMTAFYSKWLSGKSKREAYREAQLEIKAKYPKPFYWGAFVMIGE